MASNQVTAILFSASFAKCDFAQQLCDFVTSSAIHLHSSLKSIPDGYSAFSQSVHHSSFTAFAALGGLITPPEQRYRYFSLNLWPVSSHLQHILAIQLTKISRHKQSRKAAKASSRQELQKLNARDLSGATDKSGPQFLCVLPVF